MYPLLSDFSAAVAALDRGRRAQGRSIDLSPVTYVDSATIGCLMDLYRQATAAGGALKLAGVQKRVETMLTMTGAQNFIEIHADEPSARQELRGVAMRTIKTTTGAEITLDGDLLAVMEALYREVTAKRELERSLRGHGAGNPAPDRPDDDERAPRLPRREPVPEHASSTRTTGSRPT